MAFCRHRKLNKIRRMDIMYLKKHEINGETYVKLDELNDLIKTERKGIAKTMKKRHEKGESNEYYVFGHTTLTTLFRKVNMSENGEEYVIFTIDREGKFEFLVDVIAWDKLPEYVQKSISKARNGYVTFGTSEVDEATLYGSFDEADEKLREIAEKTANQEWHQTKRWMFDTEDHRESLKRLFGKKKPESEKPDKPADSQKKKGTCPGRYTVWYRDGGDTTQHCMGFVRFERGGMPVFTNRPCGVRWFAWKKVAAMVAEKCGEGFEVVDMIDQMTKEERLLRAIFYEDGMDGEEPECDGDDIEDEEDKE